ncbi:MAG: cystathionine beta-lyase [Candidimonas sp.]|nr:MAG: cystathionine beta-lyase [Candidimonas sp.]
MPTRSRSPLTALARAGRPLSGWANPPIIKGSTYLFDTVESWRATGQRRQTERVLSYGARGNETVFALEDAITELEAGYRTKLFPTGLAAIAMMLLAYLRSGDHLLVCDGIYGPVSRLCRTQLAGYGIDTTFFDPTDQDWSRYLRPETRMVYVESPGSLIYDMLDLPAMSKVCHERGILLAADNTWGASLNYSPLALGCDLSVVAATKYLGGHSDVVLGSVTASEACFNRLEAISVNLGQTVAAEDAYLVLRGMRTLALRLQRHAESALYMADWLSRQPAIRTVYHPALASDPNHALWLRDARGSNGLLTVEFAPSIPASAIERGIDALKMYGIGASWGGYESLVLPVDINRTRFATHGEKPGYLLRIHIGLEDRKELKSDFENLLRGLD